EQALITLLCNQSKRILERKLLGTRDVKRDQNFALPTSHFILRDALPDLLWSVLPHQAIALAAVQLAYVRPEHLHVIADLRHGPYCGTGGSHRVPLFDGDGGRNAFDAVHLGFVHAIEELPGVRREGLDVTALAFGKKRVEREGTLAGPAQARDNDELIEREV